MFLKTFSELKDKTNLKNNKSFSILTAPESTVQKSSGQSTFPIGKVLAGSPFNNFFSPSHLRHFVLWAPQKGESRKERERGGRGREEGRNLQGIPNPESHDRRS